MVSDARSKRLVLGLIVYALMASSCRSSPPPPPSCEDGDRRECAMPLEVDSRQRNQLRCGEDCRDWYTVTTRDSGVMLIKVVTVAGHPAMPLGLTLQEAAGEPLAVSFGRDAGPLELQIPLGPGSDLLMVEASDYARKPELVTYDLFVSLAPQIEIPVPPPPPVDVCTSAEVLERQSDADLLVEVDPGVVLRSGERGQLFERGESIGHVEVVQVFDTTARVRIAGPVTGEITVRTTAQICVPSERMSVP